MTRAKDETTIDETSAFTTRMGVLRSAVQSSLDRNVAIKIAHGSADAAVGRRQMGLWTVVAASVTLLLERRLFPMTIGLAGAYVLALRYPYYRSWAGGFATLGVTLDMAIIWSRRL